MSDSIAYIDGYFTGVMTEQEKAAFEIRCADDIGFAQEVAEYVSMRELLQEQLHDRKRQEFALLNLELSKKDSTPRFGYIKQVAYLAAACLIIALGWFSFFRRSPTQRLADSYAAEHFGNLALTMGNSDSLQSGIAAYNAGSYALAITLFQPLSNKIQTTAVATKYLGLSYLAGKHYEQALYNFDRLSAMPLYVNPGPFYMALTLMERSTTSDKQKARFILTTIIEKKLYGYQQAAQWIKQF